MLKVNGRQTPSDGKSSHCLWQGELKRYTHLMMGLFFLYLLQRKQSLVFV
jgi:hypothetical protein